MGSKGERSGNLWLLCALATIDGMDLQLLPASFRALEASLGMSPPKLALLAVCQDVAFSLSGPVWGSLADNGFSRRRLLCLGATAWGILTMILAFVSNFHMMAMLRVLNGACLGLLVPITQSIIAETSSVGDRGYNFGLIQFSNNAIGQVVATLVVTSISNKMFFGVEGWRVAFFGVGLLSLVLAAVVSIFMEEKPRPYTPENVGIVTEFKKFVSYFKIRTFVVVVLQGMVGTIPGAALMFATMYFQYLGLLDWQAAAAFSMYVLGGGCGGLLGGIIGDRLAGYSRDHGRPFTAQMSVFLGIPLVAAVFTMKPPADNVLITMGGMMFMLGVLSSWCATGCNKPIFTQIVPPGSQASVMAWEFCLEHTSGHILGPVAVGYVSQHFFGYTSSTQQVQDMPPEVRLANADALGKSIALSTVLPWTLCFVLYGFLHYTYKHDCRPEGPLGKASDTKKLQDDAPTENECYQSL